MHGGWRVTLHRVVDSLSVCRPKEPFGGPKTTLSSTLDDDDDDDDDLVEGKNE